MSSPQNVLEIYQTGPLTVVGFGGREILDQIDVSSCREELLNLAKRHGAKVLGFDLTGVKLVPSGMLGLLASLRQAGIEIHLYNPSQDVAEVLEITRLNELMSIHYLDDVRGRKDGKPSA